MRDEAPVSNLVWKEAVPTSLPVLGCRRRAGQGGDVQIFNLAAPKIRGQSEDSPGIRPVRAALRSDSTIPFTANRDSPPVRQHRQVLRTASS